MSHYGASRGCPDFDAFRTGLRYFDVYQMAAGRKYRRRGTVLGLWHQIKLELYYAATGIALVLCLAAGCGSVDLVAQDAGGVESWQGEASSEGPPRDAPSSPDLASPDENSRDADASPTTCAWSATMPHAVERCPGGAGLSCHYVDSGGRPDGWLTGCQVNGEECVYPCP